mmetsp:Transcript_21864/g.74150  ORF Transcript_21864/g.74150 Transcript_21864/m.74150 type:complete len:214 (+) Transcript_21864:721-1362(+)
MLAYEPPPKLGLEEHAAQLRLAGAAAALKRAEDRRVEGRRVGRRAEGEQHVRFDVGRGAERGDAMPQKRAERGRVKRVRPHLEHRHQPERRHARHQSVHARGVVGLDARVRAGPQIVEVVVDEPGRQGLLRRRATESPPHLARQRKVAAVGRRARFVHRAANEARQKAKEPRPLELHRRGPGTSPLRGMRRPHTTRSTSGVPWHSLDFPPFRV